MPEWVLKFDIALSLRQLIFSTISYFWNISTRLVLLFRPDLFRVSGQDEERLLEYPFPEVFRLLTSKGDHPS